MLKQYNIRYCVLSAGSRNVPFVHSVEEDPFFNCFSVVDERSAAYFALGLAQETNEPVIISCTSSTATCNYWPAVAEAYYQGVPLVVLTSDRDPNMLGQWEDQMIDQVGMYDRHVRKSVNLPLSVDLEEDKIYCERLLNEALLELDHHRKGPVHINIPMRGYNSNFHTSKLPSIRKIERIDLLRERKKLDIYHKVLVNSERILVLIGQQNSLSNELKKSIQEFYKKYNCAIVSEYMGNSGLDFCINSTLGMETRLLSIDKFEEFKPQIVITFGGNIMQGIKTLLRSSNSGYEHWSIQEDGKVIDLFKNLSVIFECSPLEFFSSFNNYPNKTNNNKMYDSIIRTYCDSLYIPRDIAFSGLFAVREIVERIPANSILHLSINDSIRLANYFKLNSNVHVYANIGTYGIDGCLSSFIGQSVASGKLSFLIIGDLSLFYDMNALRIKHIKNNVRIMMINNQGGSEFYYNGSVINSASDLHTTARHNNEAKGWVKSLGFKYISANDFVSFKKGLNEFMVAESDEPIFFEVFTEMKSDAKVIHEIYYKNQIVDVKTGTIKYGKKLIKSIVGEDVAYKLGKALKKD